LHKKANTSAVTSPDMIRVVVNTVAKSFRRPWHALITRTRPGVSHLKYLVATKQSQYTCTP
jgi:hypothetical protein